MHSRYRGHDHLASATHGSRGVVWDNGALMTYLGNNCILCLRASNVVTSSQQASSCQACIQRMQHTRAKKVRINRVEMRAGTSRCVRVSPLLRSGKGFPSVKYKCQGGIRGRANWIMDYEIAFDGAMRPEIRESHAGQRLAKGERLA
jgi:hypothetical protein